MSPESLLTQTTRETPSAPMRETFLAPTPLPACCACGLVQDETGAIPGFERWVTQRTYREIYGVNPTKLELAYTYCPTCFTKVQEIVRQYFRKIGT
jgi:hypothetical protein